MDGDGRMLVLLVPLILEHIRCSKTSWRTGEVSQNPLAEVLTASAICTRWSWTRTLDYLVGLAGSITRQSTSPP
jgi:hypothetical protein